jgi:hypothetical protein
VFSNIEGNVKLMPITGLTIKQIPGIVSDGYNSKKKIDLIVYCRMTLQRSQSCIKVIGRQRMGIIFRMGI